MALTLDSMIEQSESDYVKDKANYLIVEKKIPDGPAPEIIINPKENFEAKLSYYKNAYRNDLKLKNNPSIEIVHFEFVEDIHSYMQSYK